jgi:hypothetical protein
MTKYVPVESSAAPCQRAISFSDKRLTRSG